jgi:hypothetical protein
MEIKEVIEHGVFLHSVAEGWGSWTSVFSYKGNLYLIEFENYQAVKMNEK